MIRSTETIGRTPHQRRDYSIILAFFSLVGLLASCSTSDSTEEGARSDEQATLTTIVEPPADEPGDPQSYLSPTRIPALEGKTVAQADAEATEAGWLIVQVHDIDAPRPERPADYDQNVIGLYARDQVVVEAWTGG